MDQPQYSIRRRAGVAISTKGILTWDCTVEGIDQPQEVIMEALRNLTNALTQEYPTIPEEPKAKKEGK